MGLGPSKTLLRAVSTYMQLCAGLHGETDARAACMTLLVQVQAYPFMAGAALISNTASQSDRR